MWCSRRQVPSYSDGEQTVDQPGNQACRILADTVHRQGYCRHACGVTATGPLYSDCVEHCGSPAGEVRRDSCGCACDHVDRPGDQAGRDSADEVHRHGSRRACCDTVTGPSDTDGFEDCESPAGAVHRQSGHACDQAVEIIPQKRIPVNVGQFDDVPVPQILNEIVEVVKAVKNFPQERIPEGIDVCYACCDATTGPSGSNFGEDCGSPAGEVRRDSCGCAREDHAADGTTGHSASDCAEDRESPAGAAHERMHVQIANVPVPLAALNERISERMHDQIVDVPVPQKITENVEPGSRDSAACGAATTGSSASNCGKDGFPVDQTGDQACLFSTDSVHRQDCRYACGDAANGPSYSDFVEDCGSPAGAVRRDSCGGACDHADHADSKEQYVEFTTESSKSLADMVKETMALNGDSNRTPSDSESDLAESSDEGSSEVAKRPRHWSSSQWGRRHGARDGWSWARNRWSWRW